MKKAIKIFAREMAQLVFEIAIENEGIYVYDNGFDKVPAEFVDNILKKKVHTRRMLKLMTDAIANEVTTNTDNYLEPNPDNLEEMVLTYQTSLRDFDYLINVVVEQEYDKKFPQPAPERTIEDIVNGMDTKTLDKQIQLTQVLSAQYHNRSKTNKLPARVKKDKDNSKVMKQLSEFLIQVRDSRLNFADQVEMA
jgi:hypothetical protein